MARRVLLSFDMPSDARDQNSTRSRAAEDLHGVRILVVEDDAASRKLALLLLAASGADAVGVATAEEAMAAVTDERPDVVVVDLVLPRMGGLALIEDLKRNPSSRDLVLVAVTSLNGLDVERVVRLAGCAAYVRKPIDTETFVATIAACLGGER